MIADSYHTSQSAKYALCIVMQSKVMWFWLRTQTAVYPLPLCISMALWVKLPLGCGLIRGGKNEGRQQDEAGSTQACECVFCLHTWHQIKVNLGGARE